MKKNTKKGRVASRVLSILLAIIMAFSSSLLDVGTLNLGTIKAMAANEGDDSDSISVSIDENGEADMVFDGEISEYTVDTSSEPESGELDRYDEDIAYTPAVTSLGAAFVPKTSTFDAKYMSGGFVLKNNPVEGTDYNFVCKADDYFASDLYRGAQSSAANLNYKLAAKAKTVYFDMYNNFRYYDQSAGAYKYCDVRYEVSYDYSTFSPPSTPNAYNSSGELIKDNAGGNARIEDITGWLTYGTTKDNIKSNGKGDTWYRSFKSGERKAVVEVGVNSAGVFGLHNSSSALVAGMSTTVKATFYPSGTLKSFKDSRAVSTSPVSVKGYCIFNDLDYHEGVILGAGFKEAKLWGTTETTKWGKVKNTVDNSDLFSDFDSEKRKVVDVGGHCSDATTTQATTLAINTDGWIRGSSTKGDKFNYTDGNAGYLSQVAFASFEGSSISYCYKITPMKSGGTTRDWHVYGKLIINTGDHNSSDNKTADYRTNRTYTEYNLPNWGSSITSIVTLEPLNSNIKYVLVDITNNKSYNLTDFDSTGLIGNPATAIPIATLKSNAVAKGHITSGYIVDTNYYSNAACTSVLASSGIVYPTTAGQTLTVYVKAAMPGVLYKANFTGATKLDGSAGADIKDIPAAATYLLRGETYKVPGKLGTTIGDAWKQTGWSPNGNGTGLTSAGNKSGEQAYGLSKSSPTTTDDVWYALYNPKLYAEGEHCDISLGGDIGITNKAFNTYGSSARINITPEPNTHYMGITYKNIATGADMPITGLTIKDKAIDGIKLNQATYVKVNYTPYDIFNIKKEVLNSAGQDINEMPVELGEVLTYRLTVTNKTPQDRKGNLFDELPAGTTFVSVGDDKGVFADGKVKWDALEVTAGGSKVVTFKVQVNDDCVDKQVIKNIAYIDPIPLEMDATILPREKSNEVNNYVANQYNKEHFNKKAFNTADEDISEGVVKAGQDFTYKITIFNPSPAAVDAEIVDTLPDGVNYVSSSDGGSYSAGTGADGKNQVKWASVSIPAEGTKTVSIAVKMDEGIDGGIYTNEAVYKLIKNTDFSNPLTVTVYGLKAPEKFVYFVDEVQIDTLGFDSARNQDGNIVGVGQLLTYRVTWANPTTGVRTINIEDVLPEGTRIATEGDYLAYLREDELSDDYDESSKLLISHDGIYDKATKTVKWSFESAGNVTATDRGSVLFTVVVLPSAKNDKVENVGTVEVETPDGINEAQLIFDTNKVVNFVIKPDKKAYRTELTAGGNVEKDVTNKAVNEGDVLTYKITVDNPSDVKKTFVVKDKVPKFTTYNDGSADEGGVYSSADNAVTWTFDLEAGEQKVVSFKVTVIEDAKDNSVENKAEVLVDDADINSDNIVNIIPDDPTKVVLNADGKDINGVVKQAGDIITYYIAYHNPSEKKEITATVTDTLPADTEFVAASYKIVDEDGVSHPASKEGEFVYEAKNHLIEWTIPTTAKCYGVAIVQLRILDSAKGKTLINKATVFIPDSTKETNEVHTPVVDNPKKTAADSDGVDLNKRMVSIGQEITYTVSCENPSQEDTKIGKLVDVLPEGVDFVSAEGNYTYDEATRTVVWDNISMPAGTHATRKCVVRVNENAKSMTIKNEVVFYIDEAQASSSVDGGGEGGPEVYVTAKYVYNADGTDINKEIVRVGDTLTYKITYRNLNDKEATIRIIDTLPEDLAVINVSDNGQKAKLGNVIGFDDEILADNTVYWELKVAAREEGYVTVKVKVLDSAVDKILKNKGKLRANDYITETNEVLNPVTNNPVKLVFNEAGDEITRKFTTAGSKLTYKITWVNPADETKIVAITDVLPEEVDFISADTDGKYNDATRTVSWNGIEVGAHQRVSVSFDVKVKDVKDTTISNRAKLFVDHVDLTSKAKTETSDPDDPEPSGDDDTDVYVLSKRTYSPDGKDITDEIVKVGDTIFYRVSYKNLTSTTRTYTVTDVLPEEVDYVSSGVVPESVNSTAIKDINGRTLTFTFTAAPGTEGYVYIESVINEKAVGKIITNQATVIDDGKPFTPPPADNPVLDPPVKSVLDKNGKDINYKAVKSGTKLYYNIRIHNPSKKTETFTVTDTIQKKISFVECSNDGVYDKDTRTVTWTITLEPNADIDLSLVVKTKEGTYSKPVINMAHVVCTATEADSNEVVNYILNAPVKTQSMGGQVFADNSKIAAGSMVTYTITWNNPTNQKRKVTITDKLDSNIADCVTSISDGGSLSNGTITWEFKASANTNGTVSFTVQIPDLGAETVIKNSANVNLKKDEYLTGTTSLDTNVVTLLAEPGDVFVPDPPAPDNPENPNPPKPTPEIVQTGYSLGDRLFTFFYELYLWIIGDN